MTRIHLRYARPHMHLAEPLVGPDGVVVAGAGTTLGESVVRSLLRAGVETVVVQESADVADWEQAKTLEEALADLDARFAAESRDAILDTLKTAIAHHLAARARRRAEGGA